MLTWSGEPDGDVEEASEPEDKLGAASAVSGPRAVARWMTPSRLTLTDSRLGVIERSRSVPGYASLSVDTRDDGSPSEGARKMSDVVFVVCTAAATGPPGWYGLSVALVARTELPDEDGLLVPPDEGRHRCPDRDRVRQ